MKKLLLIVGLLLFPQLALSQSPIKLCSPSDSTLSNCIQIQPAWGLPVSIAGSSFVNITTNADTNVKATPGVVVGLTVNTAGTTSNVKIYNDADGTCSSGLIGTFDTTAVTFWTINATASIGICAKTAGGAAADITILYR